MLRKLTIVHNSKSKDGRKTGKIQTKKEDNYERYSKTKFSKLHHSNCKGILYYRLQLNNFLLSVS